MTCLQELRASGDTALLQGIPVCADGNVVLLLEHVQRCGGWILISVSTGMRVCEKLKQTEGKAGIPEPSQFPDAHPPPSPGCLTNRDDHWGPFSP